MSELQQESSAVTPVAAPVEDSVGAEVVDQGERERKPWNLALIDVAVTLVMVGLVLAVLHFVVAPRMGNAPAEVSQAGDASVADLLPAPSSPSPEALFSAGSHVDTVASIEGDEHRQRDLVLVGQGWVESLMPLRIGQRVLRGQLLMEVYSPALIDLQMEYIDAVKSGKADALQAAIDHLTVYGQSQPQIDALLGRKELDGLIAVRAPSDGVISAVYVQEGMFVPMAGAMVRLVDMSSIWMEAELLSLDARGIEPGSRVEASFPRREKVMVGVVEYIEYPERRVGPVSVRMRFDGVEQRSLLRGYVDVRIYRQSEAGGG
ncbi:MAG TPA: HlyD family efflux transporter periplasmic adaptor subunit [Candidatus Tenderia sp.]|nr:HlyD family efflux transporter periplasmic adaptor subunit [Candidatus Tenderia sp.]